MKQDKPVYSYDDALELLSEHAVGTESMKKIEDFFDSRKNHFDYLQRRLRTAEGIVGSYIIDEHMEFTG